MEFDRQLETCLLKLSLAFCSSNLNNRRSKRNLLVSLCHNGAFRLHCISLVVFDFQKWDQQLYTYSIYVSCDGHTYSIYVSCDGQSFLDSPGPYRQ